MEPVTCSECLSESVGGQTAVELEADGWDLSGEFGERCPECVVRNETTGSGRGLEAVASSLGAKRRDDP